MGKMILIYFKSDGEIHQVAYGYSTIEEYYGARAEEFKQIFDYIEVQQNDYLFNHFQDFKVDTQTKTLYIQNTAIYDIFNTVRPIE